MAAVQRCIFSKNLTESNAAVRSLYRQCLRSIPLIIGTYELENCPIQMRKRIRADFESHGKLDKPNVVDMLIIKGYQDLEETIDVWKQRSHLVNYFYEADEKPLKSLSSYDSMMRSLRTN